MRMLKRCLTVLIATAGVLAAQCSESAKPAKGQDWNGWADAANTRFQSAKAAGLTTQNTPKLKVKWAFGFPGVTTAFGAPSVVNGRVFVGAADGAVSSLDAHTGCTYWTFTADAGVRVAPLVDSRAVYFGDLKANVYAVDLQTGKQLWKTRADENPMAVITRVSQARWRPVVCSRVRQG